MSLAPLTNGGQPIVSDDFNSPSLDPILWQPFDSVGGGTFETTGAGTGKGQVRITVPGGRNHDSWNLKESLRLLQTVANQDFEVEVKFDSLPASKYQIEGIWVQDYDGLALRFDIEHDGSAQLVNWVGRRIGASNPAQQARTLITDVPIPATGNEGTAYLRVKRQGQQWTCSTSPDGTNWTQKTTFTLAIAVAQVGVHAGNYQADGNPPEFPVVLDYFFNTATPIVPEDSNMPPSISLGSPANNATFTAPANITITAIAADSDGTISKVEFFAGGALIGTATTSPYSFNWNNVPLGNYLLTAKATDDDGASRNAQPVSVVVNPSAGGGPTVTGLALWLKADAGTTLNGATVSEWADQSGQGRMAVQPTAANQPALVPTELGKPALRFDGVNDFLAFNLPVNGLDGLTIFLVANNRRDIAGTGPANAAIFWNETASWGTVYLGPFQSHVNFRFGTTQTGNQPTFSYPAPVGSDYLITTALKDRSTDSLYVNGELLWTDAFKSFPIAGCRDFGNLGRGYNDNTYFPGDFLEVLVYTRALTDAERQDVEQYLHAKYLANSLPSATITSPANNESFTAPANIAVTADALDSDGTISKVEFFAGNTLIGTANASPYTITWSTVPVGSYTITAKVTDDQGANKTSAPVWIGVNPSGGGELTFTGLALWLKADAGVTLNGSTVSGWADQSGQGRNAAQSTSGSQPTLVPAVLSGKPVVQFDGVNDFLTFSFPVNGLAGMTIFLVANNTADRTGGSTHAGEAAVFWNESVSWGTVYLSPYQSQVNFRFGTTQVGNRSIYTRPAPIGPAFTLSTAVKNETTDSLYVNGEQIVSQGDKLPAIAGCQDIGNLGRGYNDNTYFPGAIAEVLVYARALSDTERESVEHYLNAKYLANKPPTVAIASPANSTIFPEGSVVTISADAADSDGTVTQVEFFVGSTSLGVDTLSPYSITVSNLTAGANVITAKALDSGGTLWISAPVKIALGGRTIVSDDFNRASVNINLWALYNPVGDGSFSIEGFATGDTHLVIDVSGAAAHDAWTVNNALRLLQPAADLDFELEAKFDSVPAKQYQSEGIYVEQANGQFLRFDALHDGQVQLQAYVGRIVPGTSGTQVSRTAIPDVPVPTEGNAGTIYLRVKRQGDQWTFFTSPDGITWSQRSTFSQIWAVARVGVHATNQKPNATSPAPAFTARVDYFFNQAAPIVPEDSPSAAAVLNIARSGDTLVISWLKSADGFALEVTDGLIAPNWTPVATPPVVVSEENTVTLPLAGGTKFYRLKK
ncbi:MAG: Ig-like domain-containing protein [Verrucomicrobiota bacterium]